MEPKPFVRPPIVSSLDLDELAPGEAHRRRVVITENATGNETLVPVLVLKAADPTPVVGITAAIHGNELNGIRVIHRLFEKLSADGLLRGTLVAVPIVNVPGYLRQQREFEDGVDLNRIMPGDPNGNESALYANRFMERIVARFEYLFDLHTASAGRVNSLYVRADMNDEPTARLARLLSPQVILHSPGSDQTLRGAAQKRGIRAITVEVGDPQLLQTRLVRSARLGLQEVLEDLGMVPNVSTPDIVSTVECHRAYWIYTDRGGMLDVLPQVTDTVRKGERIAVLHNVWGDQVRAYTAPEDGIVIGRSVNPTASAGSRVLHLGIMGATDARPGPGR